jgi:hypothetical protein
MGHCDRRRTAGHHESLLQEVLLPGQKERIAKKISGFPKKQPQKIFSDEGIRLSIFI